MFTEYPKTANIIGVKPQIFQERGVFLQTQPNNKGKFKLIINIVPMTYKGVVVSLNPRKMPCMAKVRRTAGAPNDLVTKYFTAGASIGES